MKESADQPRFDKLRSLLDVVTAGAMIVASVVLTLNALESRRAEPSRRNTEAPLIPSEPLALGGVQLLGDVEAPVAILEYADFQCPYCSKFAQEVLPGLEQQFIRAGKVAVAFRHLPLEQRHPAAFKAAEAAQCAGRQGHFWEMHDTLFREQSSLSTLQFRRYADELGIDGAVFDSCLEGATSEEIRKDMTSATDLQVRGTPAFFIGYLVDGTLRVVERVNGMASLGQFESIVTRLLHDVPKRQQ